MLALILLFPAWATSNGTAKFDLGHSWILSPPQGLGPDDFLGVSAPDDFTEQDRRRMREYVAGGFGDPEINWVVQGYVLVSVLTVLIAGVIAARGRQRRTARS